MLKTLNIFQGDCKHEVYADTSLRSSVSIKAQFDYNTKIYTIEVVGEEEVLKGIKSVDFLHPRLGAIATRQQFFNTKAFWNTVTPLPSGYLKVDFVQALVVFDNDYCPMCSGTKFKADLNLSSGSEASGVDAVALLVEVSLNTEKGTHPSDPDFGCGIFSLQGIKITPSGSPSYGDNGVLVAGTVQAFEEEARAYIIEAIKYTNQYLVNANESHRISEEDPGITVTFEYDYASTVIINVEYFIIPINDLSGGQWVEQEIQIPVASFKSVKPQTGIGL